MSRISMKLPAAAGLAAIMLHSGLANAMTVQGAHVNIVAQWNESKSATGRYQAPDGYIIKSATPVVQSEARSSSSASVSADKREATLSVQVRGKGEFWNKERGWYEGYLNVEIEPVR